MENAFAKPIDQVLSTLEVQASTGLTDAQVKKLTEKHGKNGRFASCRKAPRAETLTDPVQLSRKSHPRLFGSSYLSNSRTNSFSSYSAPLLSPSSWLCLRTKAAGAHLSTPPL